MRASILFVLLLSLSFTSCEHPGTCQDTRAVNYKGDDGSPSARTGLCYYENVPYAIWQSYNSALAYREANGNQDLMLEYYVDGELVGTQASSIYWGDNALCDHENSITGHIDIDNEGNSYKDVMVVVKDTTGKIWIEETKTLQYTGNCGTLEVSYSTGNYNL